MLCAAPCLLLSTSLHPLQTRDLQELRHRLTAADSANLILARQEREAAEQAQAARAEATRARDALAPATIEIRCAWRSAVFGTRCTQTHVLLPLLVVWQGLRTCLEPFAPLLCFLAYASAPCWQAELPTM